MEDNEGDEDSTEKADNNEIYLHIISEIISKLQFIHQELDKIDVLKFPLIEFTNENGLLLALEQNLINEYLNSNDESNIININLYYYDSENFTIVVDYFLIENIKFAVVFSMESGKDNNYVLEYYYDSLEEKFVGELEIDLEISKLILKLTKDINNFFENLIKFHFTINNMN